MGRSSMSKSAAVKVVAPKRPSNGKKGKGSASSKSDGKESRWTPEEDEMLRAAVQLYKGKNWKKVADCFDNRKTEVQCLQHWRNVLNPTVVKGKGSWTTEEDEKLKDLVEKYGQTKWSYIGKFLPGRIGKQCRERWHNHLNPTLKKAPWCEAEENLIIETRKVIGNRWAHIARMLPGRSDNDVKNRWYASLRKRVEGGDSSASKGKGKGAGCSGRSKKKPAAKKKKKKKKVATKKAESSTAPASLASSVSAPASPVKREAQAFPQQHFQQPQPIMPVAFTVPLSPSVHSKLQVHTAMEHMMRQRMPMSPGIQLWAPPLHFSPQHQSRGPTAYPQVNTYTDSDSSKAKMGYLNSNLCLSPVTAFSPTSACLPLKKRFASNKFEAINASLVAASVNGNNSDDLDRKSDGSSTSTASSNSSEKDLEVSSQVSSFNGYQQYRNSLPVPLSTANVVAMDNAEEKSPDGYDAALFLAELQASPSHKSWKTKYGTSTDDRGKAKGAGKRHLAYDDQNITVKRATKKRKKSNANKGKSSKNSGRWLPAESKLLKKLVGEHGPRRWSFLAGFFPGRSEAQCSQHWRNVLDPSVKKGKGSWTKDEDMKLLSLVKEHGEGRWTFIAGNFGGRIGKQCRERWHNHVNPDLDRKRPWSGKEDQIVVEAHNRLGNKWAAISRLLPGRSDNDVKNRWNGSLENKRNKAKTSTA